MLDNNNKRTVSRDLLWLIGMINQHKMVPMIMHVTRHGSWAIFYGKLKYLKQY